MAPPTLRAVIVQSSLLDVPQVKVAITSFRSMLWIGHHSTTVVYHILREWQGLGYVGASAIQH